MDRLRLTVISESEFTVKGHGVHTAYLELTNAIKHNTDMDVAVNEFRDCDITHVHTVGTYALAHMLFGKGKKVVSAHITPDSLVGSLVLAKYWAFIARWYIKWFYNRADLVLAVSEKTADDLRALGVRKRIEIVHNVIDPARFASSPEQRSTMRAKLGLSADHFVVVGSGQVQPRKRVDEMIKLSHELSGMRFVWVGGMPFKRLAADHEAMERMLRSAPSNFTCTGVVEQDVVIDYFRAADAFFLPSIQETFGMVVVEAAAAGLPVVLRDIPDYEQTFKGDAMLVKPDSFTTTFSRLRDDTLFRNNAIEGSKRIAARYTAKAGAERLSELYTSLLPRT